jgi:exopolysaccharide biosynthesis WecB/TagA/CpsF family protein
MCGLIAGWGQGCPDEERVEKMGSLAELEILGCRFTRAAEAEVVKQICSWFDAPVRVSNTIVTVNVAILMMLRRDRRLAEAVGGADLVVADGVPLIWASRWLGTPLPGRVAGVDLMTRLLQLGSARRLRVFLLGTTQERLDKLVEVVGERYPGIDVVGARNGYFSIEEHRSVAEQVRDAGADLLLVGMPAPAKELWCEQVRRPRRVCTAGAALGAEHGPRMGVAAPDGAAQAVEAVPGHQHGVPRRPGGVVRTPDPLAQRVTRDELSVT